VNRWWRENADHPNIFDDELLALLERLTWRPLPGRRYGTRKGVEVRRVLLNKSEQFVYFLHDEQRDEVVIQTISGVKRGNRPRFDS
jgi:hypothetical protein